ncbi:MAG: hypothetical protein AAF191_01825 [Verrucomicrobiota bacterium]
MSRNSVEQAFRSGTLRFTLAELASSTGLGFDRAREEVDDLLRRYVARVQVTDRGEILYDFGPRLRPFGEPTLRERLIHFGEKALEVLRLVFRIWITTMLIGYFLLFALIALAALLASLQGGSGQRRGAKGWNPDQLARIFRSLFRWGTHTGTVLQRQDDQGYPYKRWQPTPSPVDEQKKSFVASVHDFALGPEPYLIEPLANEREVAAFLRAEKGIVVPADLVSLAGWSMEDAERFLVECILRFEGDLYASEGGVLYGRFHRILRDGIGDTDRDADIQYYWDEYEPEYELTGNDRSRDIAIACLNLANLVSAGSVLAGWLPVGSENGMHGPFAGAINFVFGWVPLLFSLALFVTPLLRAIWVRRANRERRANNLRKRVLRVVFRHEGREIAASDLTDEVNQDRPEEPVSREDVEDMLRRLRKELRGDDRRDETFQPYVAFPGMSLELREAKTLRQKRHVETDLGVVILDNHGGVDLLAE